jgi:hypothetical protein
MSKTYHVWSALVFCVTLLVGNASTAAPTLLWELNHSVPNPVGGCCNVPSALNFQFLFGQPLHQASWTTPVTAADVGQTIIAPAEVLAAMNDAVSLPSVYGFVSLHEQGTAHDFTFEDSTHPLASFAFGDQIVIAFTPYIGALRDFRVTQLERSVTGFYLAPGPSPGIFAYGGGQVLRAYGEPIAVPEPATWLLTLMMLCFLAHRGCPHQPVPVV